MKYLLFLIGLMVNTVVLAQGTLIVYGNSHLVNNSYLILNNMDFDVEGNLKTNGTVKFTNGNFTMNGNFDSGTSHFVFSNTTTHDHYLSTSNNTNNTFYNLSIIGNVSTVYDLHLLSDINVLNHLEIQSQKFNLNNHGIDLGTTGHLYYEGNGQYLYEVNPSIGNGYIKSTYNILANSTTNPGNLGLVITTNSNQMGITTITRYHKRTDIGGGQYSVDRIFKVEPTYNGNNYSGGLNVELEFQYFNDMLGLVNDVSNLKLYRSGDGGLTWENKGGLVDISNNFVHITNFNQFSQVTIAPDNATPLPVELLYFDGYENSIFNVLKWSTASEHNSDYFEIENSTNGVDWSVVGIKKSAGNSTNKIDYSYSHMFKYNTYNYYRLKQVDFDGKYKIYGPISIDNTIKTKKIIKYVNAIGQEVDENTRGLIFEVYEDGSTNKIIR